MNLPYLRLFILAFTLGGPLLSHPSLAGDPAPAFMAAQPVWLPGRETERNLTVGFRAVFPNPFQGRVFLRATGSTLYRVFLNGEFLGHGPARGPHGYFRVDEWDLTGRLEPGLNVVAFEVAGYNVNSYYLLDQPSFLQAEVAVEGRILAATGATPPTFHAQALPERMQKVQRYSFQRPFTEIYTLKPDSTAWRTNHANAGPSSKVARQPQVRLLARELDFPKYLLRQPQTVLSQGTLQSGGKVERPWKDRSLTGIGPALGGYPEAELTAIPSLEWQGVTTITRQPLGLRYSTALPSPLPSAGFRILDFGVNLTGFLGVRLECSKTTRLILTFDEVLTEDDVNFRRLDCVNLVEYRLEPGAYTLETFEPYTLRYLKLAVLDGDCVLQQVYLRELAAPGLEQARFESSDEALNRLFAAGVETFRQNALDVFMDCPSRERAGWLCDSFFTARVAKDLQGDGRMEHVFLQNFLLPEKFTHLPEGMLPMCYPADHNDGVFIPNWALWFVLQLEEYATRTGDQSLVQAFEPRVRKLFDYFRPFENSDGLLEKLAGWVFVEWSAANSFVQDVNYPSNMLYARALLAAGRLYGRADLVERAEHIRNTIRTQAFDGRFFVDNAVRREGRLEVTTNRTEVCQYFAFFFDVASPASHPELWRTLLRDFGPGRKQTRLHPEVHPANAFVGNVLRLELLSREGLARQLLQESLAYQMYMVERTGTLWENDGAYASCNHGFASHGGVHVLFRDVLGLREVDPVKRRVKVRFTDPGLAWCHGVVPTPHGLVTLRWRLENGRFSYDLHAPAGYEVEVEAPPN